MRKRSNAERLDNVTIYHSDILDFTNIVQDSTPMEVRISSLDDYFKLMHFLY